MAAISTITLDTYAEQLYGGTLTINDNTVIAGMEDIINKISMIAPAKLQEFVTRIAVTSVPLSINNVTPGLRVLVNNEEAIDAGSAEHVENRYSLKNDSSRTAYYYLIGNQLYITPFDATKNLYYVYAIGSGNAQYSSDSSGGTLVWPAKYIYPLALFCASDAAFAALSTELASITAAASTGMPAVALTITTELATATSSIAAGDVELAREYLHKVELLIAEYSAEFGAVEKLASVFITRVQNAANMFNRYATLWGRYNEYFGLMKAGEKNESR